MNLIVVRHGETEWNAMKKVQGQANIPLNYKGMQQAMELKEYIKHLKIDMVISSPLLRASQTAEILFENNKIYYDYRIVERNFGEFEGLTINEFNSNDFWSYKKNIKYKFAENIHDFFERVFDFLKELERKYEDKTIFLVAHVGIIIAVESYFKGIPEDDNFFKNDIKNCNIFKYTTEKAHNV